jgi:hypothetical protein
MQKANEALIYLRLKERAERLVLTFGRLEGSTSKEIFIKKVMVR